ncbi:uncharacterized protein LOC112574356 [Pomacea canaliculata]|uniref:uncharacterized protein LOC112574356 n=1 Tax=Pomacea canaliculata TaxID=400727 RepID=UPI000D7315AD|nr:uncharacterized protein LOC112574356 [Pomacea canaliculata]
MSGAPSSAPKQALGLSRRETREGAQPPSTVGDNHQECYKHAVTDKEAALLTTSGNPSPLEEIQKKTGAQVQLDPDPSPVQGTKIVVIRGSRSQIEDTVRLINRTTGAQEMITAQAEAFWLEWVLEAFPDLDSSAYFLPPVYVNRVPMTREIVASMDVLVLQEAPTNATQDTRSSKRSPTSDQVPTPRPSPVQQSDVRDDGAMQRVFLCLREMANKNNETLVALTQLQFGDYLGEPCYSAAAAQMPLPKTLPADKPRQWKYGDFDIILIHREYGFVVCEVKAIGEKVSHMTEQELHESIGNKLKQAVSQLDKAETMLSHLVSDIDPHLRITKTMAFPNLTATQVQQAIASDPQLTQELCRCLGTVDPTALTRLCLCSDQLSNPDTPSDVNDDVLRELGEWWQHRVTSPGPDSHMTSEIYKKLVARFCGPATTVTVPCIYPTSLCQDPGSGRVPDRRVLRPDNPLPGAGPPAQHGASQSFSIRTAGHGQDRGTAADGHRMAATWPPRLRREYVGGEPCRVLHAAARSAADRKHSFERTG